MEYFEHKKQSSHQLEEQLVKEQQRIKMASEAWEKEKAQLSPTPLEKAKPEDIESTWKEFISKFKPELGYRRFVAKAKFMDLYCLGFDFGAVKENKNITPLQYLQGIGDTKCQN